MSVAPKSFSLWQLQGNTWVRVMPHWYSYLKAKERFEILIKSAEQNGAPRLAIKRARKSDEVVNLRAV